MTISDLVGLLGKVQSMAGDVDVVLRHAVDGVETVVKDLQIHLTPSTGQAGGSLVIEHETAPAPPPPEPAPPATDTAAQA